MQIKSKIGGTSYLSQYFFVNHLEYDNCFQAHTFQDRYLYIEDYSGPVIIGCFRENEDPFLQAN